ncbi:MAG TPA: hypothetical protein PLM79_11905 [Syntrophobacteraceae bacterium]|nr:hypothetical protein [Syntrophobacteraceae bacterium]
MATVMPEGEAIRKAIKWISEELKEHPEKTPTQLVGEATLRFDLSPKEGDFLLGFYSKASE